MKRIVICCVLTALIFAGGIWGVIYTSKVGDDIRESIRQVKDCYSSGDKEGAMAAAKEASDIWRGFRELHILILDNDHALEITMAAQRLERLVESDSDEVTVECGLMDELVRSYCREQELRLGNVF